MSDFADSANEAAELFLAASLRLRKESHIKPCGSCHYCSEQITHGGLFCDSFCGGDFEKEEAARRRNGKV